MSADLEIKIKTTLEDDGVRKAAEQVKSFAAAAQTSERAVEGSSRAAKEAAGTMEQFGRRGSEAKDAMEGLRTVAAGGEGAIFGMAKAWRALTVAFAANPITAALALILGLLPLIKKGFDLIGDAAENSVKKLAGSGERTAAFAEGLKQIGENSARYIKAATADVDALSDALGRANSAIDAALRRFKEVEGARAEAEQAGIELQRQSALAKAGTPEDRDRITNEFDQKSNASKSASAAAISNKELSAAAQKASLADSAKRDLEKGIADADAKVVAARAAERKARDAGDVDAAGLALNARLAAERDAEAVRAKNSPLIEKAQAEIDDSDAAIRVNELRFKTARTTAASSSIAQARQSMDTGNSNSYSERRAELRQNAESAQARGDFAAQDRAVAELKKMNASANKLSAAISDSSAAIGKSFEAAGKDAEGLKRRLANERERSGGG